MSFGSGGFGGGFGGPGKGPSLGDYNAFKSTTSRSGSSGSARRPDNGDSGGGSGDDLGTLVIAAIGWAIIIGFLFWLFSD